MRALPAFAAFTALLTLGACETVPYAERVAAYEASVNAQFVGKSADELVLALGPPMSSFKLSDGRDVFQYARDNTYTTGGGSYTSYESYTRRREVIRPDGTVQVIKDRESVPVQRVEPLRTVSEVCVRRFVMSKDGIVESFRWEGNDCF